MAKLVLYRLKIGVAEVCQINSMTVHRLYLMVRGYRLVHAKIGGMPPGIFSQ